MKRLKNLLFRFGLRKGHCVVTCNLYLEIMRRPDKYSELEKLMNDYYIKYRWIEYEIDYFKLYVSGISDLVIIKTVLSGQSIVYPGETEFRFKPGGFI